MGASWAERFAGLLMLLLGVLFNEKPQRVRLRGFRFRGKAVVGAEPRRSERFF